MSKKQKSSGSRAEKKRKEVTERQSHSACKTCLQQFWSSNGCQECPLCRRRSSKSDPPLNLALRSLCECFLESRKQKSLSAGSEELCSLHSEKLKLFCVDDQQCVCMVCHLSKSHKDHTCCPIDEAVTDCKNKLQTALKPLQKNLEVFRKSKYNYDQTAAHIKIQAQNTEQQIKEEFEQLHQFLRDEETRRLAALKEEEERKSERMRKKTAEIKREISALSHKISNIKKELEANDIHFLNNFKVTLEQVKWTEKNPEKVSGALIDVSKHLSNLKFSICKSILGAFQYTPVTLDPNTAHPQLCISEDLTAVVFKEQKSSVPDNPERFKKDMYVVGSEVFTSGVHCWDVEVGGGGFWELGVMRESTDRESTDRKSTDRESTDREIQQVLKYHVMLRFSPKDVYIFSSEQLPQSFRAKTEPLKIRVKLNLDMEKLTFTDLTTNAHMHTITHIFTKKVYPVFCNKNPHCPLKILPASANHRALEELAFTLY